MFWTFMPIVSRGGSGSWRVPGPALGVLAGMGVFGYAVMAALLFASYRYVPIGVAVTVFYTYPLWVNGLTAALVGTPMSRRKTGGLLLSLAGLAAMFGGGWNEPAQAAGIGLAFAAALVYAAFILVSDRVLRRASPYVSSAYVAAFAAAALALFAWATGGFERLAAPSTWAPWAAAGSLAFVSTFGAITLFAASVRRLGPNTASIVSFVEPPAAAALGALFLQQTIEPQQIAGGALILIGIALAQTEKAAASDARTVHS
ncbi:DMT family transporter [Paenibacillus antri]|uniref:DMT family transporter n=1 Tax=Paenibacillus antri TaxID=2582848 RepID=A0A5R9G7I4_9BACL|nr:DMT family transporter [Paenibacillus antri]TLS48984.1 DMT family transporter [Paenibacillus antri]